MIDATVLKNKVLLAGPGLWPSCSASMETVAAVGKQIPKTTIHFIIGWIGRKYTSPTVIAGRRSSLTTLASMMRTFFMISRNRYSVRFDPIKIIAIGVEMLPI